MHKVRYEWVGEKTYAETWEYQESLQHALIQAKRQKNSSSSPVQNVVEHYLLLCEHSPVFTLGRSGDMSHLLIGEKELLHKGIEFFKINRGGDITYHGPGQITGYPIFDLDEIYTDIHRYVRELEEVVIRTLANWGLMGERIPAYTGVWVRDRSEENTFKKICAIGVHLSRWVTLHGFALNVNTDLKYFDLIVP